jgi:FkbM family methyltransferase
LAGAIPVIPHWLTISTAEIEQTSRAQVQAAYFGDETILCRILGRYLMYADTNDVGITPHLSMNGYWESWITLALARVIRPGWHCLDVGANHGYYTLLMADGVGPSGQVLAVEPNPDPVRRLQHTLDVNGFVSHVGVVQKAASDVDGDRVELFIAENRGMNASLRGDAGKSRTERVETVTIDALTRDWRRVDLVKIDVEGAEERVWRGMTSTLGSNPELTIILEVNTNRYDEPAQFFESIKRAGFELRYIDFDGELKPVEVDRLLHERRGEDWMLFLQRTIDV